MPSIAYGYEGKTMPADQFLRSSLWLTIAPEIRRRLWALIVSTDYRLGVGGAWRSTARQVAMFIERHDRVTGPTRIVWDGSYWKLKPGMTACAVPGDSYHESCVNDDGAPDDSDATGLCVAIDTLNLATIGITDATLAAYGLRNFDSELWHVQPLEWPAKRAHWDYDPIPLRHWPLPGQPATNPQPLPLEDDMPRLIQPANDAAVFLLDGLQCSWVRDGNVLADLLSAGIVPATAATKVTRRSLGAFVLVGPAPAYTTHPPSEPERTKPTDFAGHRPNG